MRVSFPKWPVWNYHFPETDVRAITRVAYRDKLGAEQTLSTGEYRLCIGRNGVSGIAFINKGNLPELSERTDSVTIEYDV